MSGVERINNDNGISRKRRLEDEYASRRIDTLIWRLPLRLLLWYWQINSASPSNKVRNYCVFNLFAVMKFAVMLMKEYENSIDSTINRIFRKKYSLYWRITQIRIVTCNEVGILDSESGQFKIGQLVNNSSF